jgi:hypothetical protein
VARWAHNISFVVVVASHCLLGPAPGNTGFFLEKKSKTQASREIYQSFHGYCRSGMKLRECRRPRSADNCIEIWHASKKRSFSELNPETFSVE